MTTKKMILSKIEGISKKIERKLDKLLDSNIKSNKTKNKLLIETLWRFEQMLYCISWSVENWSKCKTYKSRFNNLFCWMWSKNLYR